MLKMCSTSLHVLSRPFFIIRESFVNWACGKLSHVSSSLTFNIQKLCFASVELVNSELNPFLCISSRLLDRACTAHKRGRRDRNTRFSREFTREEGSATYIHTHASLINESSATLTNFPTPADSCIGSACEAGFSVDAWKVACVTADGEPWVSERGCFYISVPCFRKRKQQHKQHRIWSYVRGLREVGIGRNPTRTRGFASMQYRNHAGLGLKSRETRGYGIDRV